MGAAEGAQRDLLHRRRHGRLDGHGGARFSVGVGGQLVVDQFPYTALSRTYSADSITPDSAPTMTAMMTGVNTNQSVIGFGERTEPNDFNHDGDGAGAWTLLELAKARGMRVGVVSTAQITHATPAATFAHINQRNNENDIALQALPTDATYNRRLGGGIDVLMGGGRQFFVPTTSSTKKVAPAAAPTAATCAPSSRRRATSTSGTGRVQRAVAPACRSSGCSSAATWSTSSIGRPTSVASRASPT